MNNILMFDFIVNKDNHTISIKREFAADLQLVWAAWTEADILDQWWAPKPFKNKTKSMDCSTGGFWHYCMTGPENEVHWCRFDYQEVVPLQSYQGTDAFCDEAGVINHNMPRNNWYNKFSHAGDHTIVNILLTFSTLEDLEKIISMGFKEGFSAGLENLDQYIAAQFYLRKKNKPNNKARVSSYLNFPGNTEDAFNFYKKVFKSEFINGIQRFRDIPQDENQPPVSDNIKDMVLHVELPILGGHIIMGTDAPKEMGFTLNKGNNLHICLEPESREEAKRIFDELSEGGIVTMPLADMFFGAYFGEFSDKYGINWMINFQQKD
jgi:PhnB protein